MPQVNVDGTPIFYEVDGKGPPLLMVQGFAMDHTGWMFQVPVLRRHFTCLLMDTRGFGRSGGDPNQCDLSRLARDGLAVIEDQKLGKAHVLGIDLGGMVALQMALDHPDRVDRLGLCGTSALLGEEGGPIRSLREHIDPEGSFNGQRFARALVPMLFSDIYARENESMVVQFCDQMLSDLRSGAPLAAQLDAMLGFDVRQRLAEVSHRTLVVTGTADELIDPNHSYELADLIDDTRLIELGGGSHAIMIERSNDFNRAVARFFVFG